MAGGKGRNLLRINALGEKLSCREVKISVPAFFVVSPEVNLYNNSALIENLAKSLGTELFAVRSSYEQEGVGEHTFDGVFQSNLRVPLNSVITAIQEVRNSAITVKSLKYAQARGIELKDRMPAIVQTMVTKPECAGVVYSKFPCPHDVAKVISIKEGKEYIDVLRRNPIEGITFIDTANMLVTSGLYKFSMAVWWLVQKVAELEKVFGYHIKSEFAYKTIYEFWNIGDVSLLQATRLTKITESERFKLPQLYDKGLLGVTEIVNMPGDIMAPAFVMHGNMQRSIVGCEEIYALELFDNEHQNGYILVTPCLKFELMDIDYITPNKKAVIGYEDAFYNDHDFEIARIKELLYLGFGSERAIDSCNVRGGGGQKPLIETGDTLRVVSDGIRGFVYKIVK